MTAADQLYEQVSHLMDAGDLVQAGRICDELNVQFPEFAPGWFIASRLALKLGKPSIGIEAIDRALSLVPGRAGWLLQRIECMRLDGDRAGAVALSRHLASQRFDSAQLASRFGTLLARLGLYDEALSMCRRAVELEPGGSRYHYRLAAVLRFIGDADAALEELDECVRLDPDDVDAYLMRAGLRTPTDSANDVAALEALYERTAGDPASRLRVCYALASQLDELGDYARSFNFLAEGSSLRRQQITYEPAHDIAALQAIQSTIDSDQIARSALGHVNAEPIFVVGMPRTGTALVQHVLCAHSVVKPAGEEQVFAVELLKRCGQMPGPATSSAAELITRAPLVDFALLGEAYVEAARPREGSAAHFVDSMPLNFMHAGMIHMALPKARIVLLRRHPMDSCYAAYKTLFERVYTFSYDLQELGEYYVAFHELTNHWLEVMADTIHVVSYEELVSSPRPVIERLLEFCALSLEDDCVSFFDDKSTARSSSAAQLRRAFSRASIGDWRRYERQLQPVAEILSEAGIPIE